MQGSVVAPQMYFTHNSISYNRILQLQPQTNSQIHTSSFSYLLEFPKFPLEAQHELTNLYSALFLRFEEVLNEMCSKRSFTNSFDMAVVTVILTIHSSNKTARFSSTVTLYRIVVKHRFDCHSNFRPSN